MKLRRKLGMLVVTMASLVMVCWLGPAQASTILYEWGLPTANLNGYPGGSFPNRSNFAPTKVYASQPTTYQIGGDNFTIGALGQQYHIETVRLWMLYGVASDSTDTSPLTFGTGITLMGGPSGGSITPRSSTYTATRVWYADATNFQRTTDGAWRGIWQIDFQVNENITGGQVYDFFIDGLFHNATGQWQPPSVLASNAANSGIPGPWPTDNTFLYYNTGTGEITTGAPLLADTNIQIYGDPVPLPSSLLLLGSGLLGLAGWRRRLTRS